VTTAHTPRHDRRDERAGAVAGAPRRPSPAAAASTWAHLRGGVAEAAGGHPAGEVVTHSFATTDPAYTAGAGRSPVARADGATR
jgi:hypothetical protein